MAGAKASVPVFELRAVLVRFLRRRGGRQAAEGVRLQLQQPVHALPAATPAVRLLLLVDEIHQLLYATGRRRSNSRLYRFGLRGGGFALDSFSHLRLVANLVDDTPSVDVEDLCCSESSQMPELSHPCAIKIKVKNY